MSSKIPSAFFKTDDDHFYRVRTGEVIAVNMTRESIKLSKTIPSLYVGKFEVVDEKTFETAYELILSKIAL